ncbi:hypothetical protein BYT27DRAFT_7193177 [Phlegmacium glaucopus]|nr:hypothetical protein BYT27DRAFT_7193177 [Phlegmacium glaucopus]
MSSNEDDYNDGDTLSNQGLKKRRIQRACDICRRKKVRCDGVQMPGNRCSNCVSYSLDCTYVEASKKRGPPKGYVESLENRVEKLDKLLRKLLPDDAVLKALQDTIDKERSPLDPSPLVATQQHPTSFHASPTNTLTSAIHGTSDFVASPDDLVDDDATVSIISDNLAQMVIESDQYRFFGESSASRLVQAAMDLKTEYIQSAEPFSKESQTPKFSKTKLWGLQDWELKPDQQLPQYTFPEADLASNLVDLYFAHINTYHPLLHRPTFETSVAEGLHYRDERFASTYLLVCAVGSRFSDDQRVLLDGFDAHQSCGWKWFNQVQMVKKSFMIPATLYDIQFYALSVHFLQGTSAPQSCWTMVGIGIRLAQDVGAHRRKKHQQTPTVENEQWNRAFWVLICMDRMISASLGRPCAIHDEDFNIDLPVDCDDEYWDNPDPEQRFKQPENKPSSVSGFILYIGLNQILSKCLRTIYATNQSKILLGYVGQRWEQDVVAQLDSSLNQWVDTVPDHLRWDPNRQDIDFFNKSAVLYMTYYHIQILIHRPFIPAPNKPSPLSYPSLAICTNAARSCSHIADIMRRKIPLPPLHTSMAVFTAGIVLVFNIWGGKRSGLALDPNKEMTDVHKCMKALKVMEDKWRAIGRLHDILCELTSAGDLPMPQPSPMATNKRERDCDTPISSSSSESPPSVIQEDTPRVIAGSLRVNKDLSGSRLSKKAGRSQQQQQPPPPLPSKSSSQFRQPSHNQQHPDRSVTTYTLPMYSDELGRLPLHGHMNFSAPSLDQGHYWYPNSGSAVGGNEGNANSNHTLLSNPSSLSSLSHHSNRHQHQQAQDHNHVQSSHNNTNYPHSTTETSRMTQGFPLNPTMGTGAMMFDPMSLGYIPPGSYAAVSPSMDMGPRQNPLGLRGSSSYPNFREVSMALRGDLGGVVDQRQKSSQPPSHLEQPQHQHHHQQTQGQREHHVHSNHHHREQQQQPMGYSYVDDGTMAMWSTAPTGFEYAFFLFGSGTELLIQHYL